MQCSPRPAGKQPKRSSPKAVAGRLRKAAQRAQPQPSSRRQLEPTHPPVEIQVVDSQLAVTSPSERRCRPPTTTAHAASMMARIICQCGRGGRETGLARAGRGGGGEQSHSEGGAEHTQSNVSCAGRGTHALPVQRSAQRCTQKRSWRRHASTQRSGGCCAAAPAAAPERRPQSARRLDRTNQF